MRKERKRPATKRNEKKEQILRRLKKDSVLYTKRQKSSKHRKFKPLDYVGSKIDGSLMDKPATNDNQSLPRSLREMIEAQENFKKKKSEKKAAGKRKPDVEGAKKKYHHQEQLERRKGESDWQYASRLETVAREAIVRSQYAKKFKVDPNVMNVKKKKGKNAKNKIKRLKEKKKNKIEASREKRLSGFEHLQDKIEFGEVVKAPPKLTAVPGRSKKKT